MKSWTSMYGLVNAWTGTQSSSEQTLIKQYLNDSIRTIATVRNGRWKWLEATYQLQTVANQATYQFPNGLRKAINLQIQIAGTNPVYYNPTPVYSQDIWNNIVASRLGTSDVALFTYVQDKQFTIVPTPATSGNYINIRGRVNVRDLSVDDYSSGNITTATNGATAIVGTGTSWTTPMAGRYIRITDDTQGGDGFWYQIASVTDATHLTLVKNYEGASISGGTATYVIGEMSPIPESYDVAPCYRATALYWQYKENQALAKSYWLLYDGGKEANLVPANAPVGGIIGQMLQEAGETQEGPYISPNRVRMIDPNVPPQNLTGF